MKQFVNVFQTVTKNVTSAAQEDHDIQIKGCNSITIINNTINNLISWDNYYNYIQPNQSITLRGNEDEFISGILKIILFENVVGWPDPKCVLIKKKYLKDATI